MAGTPSRAARFVLSGPVLAGLAIVAAAFFSLELWGQRGRATEWDFSHYYTSGAALHAGMDPYRTDLSSLADQFGLHIEEIRQATLPPTVLALFAGLAHGPPRTAYGLWIGANVLGLLAAVWLLGPGAGLRWRPSVLLGAAVLLYEPIGDHFFYGQTQILVLLLLALGAWALRTGHRRTGDAAWAAAGTIKLFPLLLALRYVARRDGRGLLRWGMALGALGVLTLLAVGPGVCTGFFTRLGFITGDAWRSAPANIALGSILRRWIPNDAVAAVASWAGVAGLVASTAWCTRRAPGTVGLGLWVTTMILASPTAWLHYLVLLCVPFFEIAVGVQQGWAPKASLRWAVASYGLAQLALGPLASIGPLLSESWQFVLWQLPFAALAMAHFAAWSLAREADVRACPAR